jgi:hypothetical protein
MALSSLITLSLPKSLTAEFLKWMITGVYGPQGDLEKKMFIRELKGIKSSAMPRWLMIGDFNLIFREEDKNNNRLNRNLMLQFRRAINHLEVKEIQLKGRKFTWSNGQQAPTMTNIDRAFCSPQLEDCFQNPVLQALSSPISDHCPLLLTPFPTQWLDQNSDLKGTGLICLDSMIVSRGLGIDQSTAPTTLSPHFILSFLEQQKHLILGQKPSSRKARWQWKSVGKLLNS